MYELNANTLVPVTILVLGRHHHFDDFVGNKNLNEVMERLAFEAAMNEENITA